MIFFEILHKFKIKYLLSALTLILSLGLVFGQSVPDGGDEPLPLPVFGVGGEEIVADSLEQDELAQSGLAQDSLSKEPPKTRALLGAVMRGSNTDSLYYDVTRNRVYIYNEGDVSYQNKSLKADNMQIDMELNEIYAYGKQKDSIDGSVVMTQPVFIDGDMTYTMDTITYNMKSERAKIKGVATQEGEGWLVGSHVKKMEDNVVNIKGGKYTTCENIDHPHFYLAMTKAKVIPGEKVVTGPAYIVLEDVPLYFLGIPEGFFPISLGTHSGFIMPTYGEDGTRGFYLRDMGYYFALNDYMDLTLKGGFYTLGSWESSATSRYVKKYKYSGNVYVNFTNTKIGEKTDADYSSQNNFKIQWTHSQDAKANPGSTFSASVNFTTSGYSKYSATTLNDMLTSQTNSTIAYSKTWSKVSLSTNMSVSQNSQTEMLAVTLPSAVVSVSRFYPFKFGKTLGSDKWYEKISMSYSGQLTNSVTASESDFFTRETFDSMSNGVKHSIPVSASFNLFNYINVSPSFNYNENWYFSKQEQEWNPETNQVDVLPNDYGFYRLYNYSTSLSASTTVYGMMQAKKKTNPVQAIRHTLTPTFGFSYAPDFSGQKYGAYATVQTDSLGTTSTYSPFSNGAYSVPSSGKSLSMNGSLSQTLEMKVRSDRDSTGVRKITLIDNLSISASYNFLADSMRLSTIPVSFRTTIFGNFGVNLSLTLDPYKVSPEGVRYDKIFLPGRVTSTGWSFGYTFKSRQDKSGIAINDITSIPPEYSNPYYDPGGTMDPVLRRQYLAQTYYDFSLPWNVGFNYVINYGISYVDNGTTGYEPNVTQSVGFSGSLVVTDKTGLNFSGGFDLVSRELTTSSISITRDLHCWQMSFSWIPFGYYKSWSFNIGVKSAALADLKYERSQSMYDNMY